MKGVTITKALRIKDIITNNIRYSALINNNVVVRYETDGFFNPHLTLEQFKEMVINETKQKKEA